MSDVAQAAVVAFLAISAVSTVGALWFDSRAIHTPQDVPRWDPGPVPEGWEGGHANGWILESAYPTHMCFVTKWSGYLRASVRTKGGRTLLERNFRDWEAVGAHVQLALKDAP